MKTHAAKRSQLTLGLGVLFAALLGIIAWMEIGGKKSTNTINNDIQSIVIKRNGHPNIELTRSGPQWKMNAPFTLNANAQRIDPLLSLGRAEFDGYAISEVDLPATGLDSPPASVLIGTREFMLGSLDTDGERRYTLVDGKVSFVPGWVWSLIHGGVTAFAELNVFTQLPNELYVIKPDGATQIAEPQNLLTLQADKISNWPEDTVITQTPTWLLSSSTHSDTPIARIRRYEDYSLINTGGDFAYRISNARLDALLVP